GVETGNLGDMKRRIEGRRTGFQAVGLLIWAMILTPWLAGEAPATATAAFNAYAAKLEAGLGEQHRSGNGFVATVGFNGPEDSRLRKGELIIEKLTPTGEADLRGAMLHDWRGTAFIRGASVADFERLMKNYAAYPQRFSPQVMEAKILPEQVGDPNHFMVLMRVRQHHVITVVMDTTYDVTFRRLDAQHAFSISRSTRISEIGSPGTAKEHALSGSEEHGFLWRLNTYWSCEERDGGIYVQIESASLTRSIPAGLGWVIRPFVESVPRESLEFTLHAVCDALRR
ncbi:MAG TPA: hypothetical protein VGT44_23555, partial [Ktedonobacteraceae bacterium]|nr:hypothetical protein [Ktedonobacteraceae bacterium]